MQYCGSPSWLSHLEIDWCFMVAHTRTQVHMQMHTQSATHTLTGTWKTEKEFRTSATNNPVRSAKKFELMPKLLVQNSLSHEVVRQCSLQNTVCNPVQADAQDDMFTLFQWGLRDGTGNCNYREHSEGFTENIPDIILSVHGIIWYFSLHFYSTRLQEISVERWWDLRTLLKCG